MTRSHTIEKITRQALEQHQQIHFYLDQIIVTLRQLEREPADAEPMRRLAAQLAGLQERVVEHQKTEENGGLFRALIETLPDSKVEVGRLVNEHRKMIEILEMARIHAQLDEPSQAGSLGEDLRGFLEMFRRHEHDEERLIRRAMAEPTRALD
jgi:hemerythrin